MNFIEALLPTSLQSLDGVEHFAPVITATIAVLAATVAIVSIIVQKTIARKRAAIDFFLKTEMDGAIVTAYAKAEKALKVLKEGVVLDEFSKTDDYENIRAYLNIHELIAVGIRNKVLHEKVCYHYWSAVLSRHCREADDVIRHAVGLDNATYVELKKLNTRWEKKLRRWRGR